MTSNDERCLNCNVSLQGAPIPEKYRVHQPNHDDQVARYGRCYCFPYGDATHFGRKIGVEVQGVYDGVLFWMCPDCGWAWGRWDGGRLGFLSVKYAALHNERSAEEETAS